MPPLAGSRRLLHPLRGVRFGEATQPGPSSGSQPSASQTSTQRTLGDEPPSYGSQPGQAWPLENDVYVLPRPKGKPAKLACLWLPKYRSWRWSCGSGDQCWQHQSLHFPCRSPSWLDGTTSSQVGCQALETHRRGSCARGPSYWPSSPSYSPSSAHTTGPIHSEHSPSFGSPSIFSG